jgi:hypothetical protein
MVYPELFELDCRLCVADVNYELVSGLADLLRQYADVKRRVFVSFHHADQGYRNAWDQLTDGMFINKSVHPGDIAADNSTEYIARLIRQEFISDASVVVVLVGPRAYCRKHVDWEISAGLDPRTGGRSGLVGFLLPNHPDFGPGKSYNQTIVPARLVDNLTSGYASLFDWTDDRELIRQPVQNAFENRISVSSLARNGRIQMTYNTCD